MRKDTRIDFTMKRVFEVFQHEQGKTNPTFFWDNGCPGLGLRITQAGARSYIFQKVLAGNTIRLTLGDIANWTLSEAQQETRRLANMIDRGIDPRKEIKAVKTAMERDALTVADIWQQYIESRPRKEDFLAANRKPPKNAWGKRHRQDHIYQGEHILKPLMPIKATSLDYEAVKKWLNISLGQGRDTAVRQAFLKIRACWRWANENSDIFGDLESAAMFSRKDITNDVPSAGTKSDVLYTSQLSDWFTAVRAISNKTISAYLQCLILCGARRGELAAVRWTDVNEKLRTLHLHDKIDIGGRTIPITNYMFFLINNLPRNNEYVFASNRAMGEQPSKNIVEPRKAHKRALKSIGLSTELTLHGLRRSFASIADSFDDLPAGVAAQLMGHKPSATAEKHYVRRSMDVLRKWHQRLEDFILENAGIDPNAFVEIGKLQIVNSDI